MGAGGGGGRRLLSLEMSKADLAEIIKNPKKFIAEMSQADPDAVQSIIEMLEQLIADNENTVSDILQRVDDTAKALNNEQQVLREVIAMLESLMPATCTCSTPGEGTVDKNEFQCTNGETSHCGSDQECYATEEFIYGEWSDGCRYPQATCTCTTPGEGTVGQNEFQCTNGETRHCASDQECYATEELTFGKWSDGCRVPPEEEILFERHSCGEQVKNLGEFQSAHDCALVVAGDAECTQNLFMWSSSYPVWGCRCCESADNPKEHDLWNLYSITTTSGCEDDPFGYVQNIEGTCADAVNMGICNEDVSEYFTLFDEPILANDPRLCPLSCGAC